MVGGVVVSILVFAVGAILDFAVTVNTTQHGFNIRTVGVILMIVGVVGFVASLASGCSWTADGIATGPSLTTDRDILPAGRTRTPRCLPTYLVDTNSTLSRASDSVWSCLEAALAQAVPKHDSSHRQPLDVRGQELSVRCGSALAGASPGLARCSAHRPC